MLEETIRHAHSLLAFTDNVGESEDWRDLTYLVDYLAYAVGKALPEHPCREGCAGCCRGVYPVTELEWRPIRAFLQARGALEHFREAARRFVPHRPVLAELAACWTRHEEPVVSPIPLDCPFLEGGSCRIYPVRPFICRGYGLFAVMLRGEQVLLMCPAAGASLQAKLSQAKALPLPRWEPYRVRGQVLNGEQPVKPLPLWLLDEALSPFFSIKQDLSSFTL